MSTNLEVIIILPSTPAVQDPETGKMSPAQPAEILRFSKATRHSICSTLLAHHVGAPDDAAVRERYANLIDDKTNGKLSVEKIGKLLEERAWTPQPQDLDDMINPIIERLRKDMKKPNEREFRMREEEEDPNKPRYAGSKGAPPDVILKGEKDIEEFLTKKGIKAKNKTVSPRDAKEWIEGFKGKKDSRKKSLRERLLEVVKVAKKTQVIFHEPHHELTPGMLLIDEIFRALVSEADGRIRRINKSPVTDQDLTELKDFVDGLGNAKNVFGQYIIPGGSIAGLKGKPYHIDPPRIELFLEGNRIVASSIIVGAWKGGTHSQGHTSG